MSRPKQILCVFASLLALLCQGQHTPLTSQYLFNGLVINPAYAGSRDALAANLTYRHQWVGFEGAPVTQMLSIHAPMGKRKLGLGVMLYNDKIGVSQETGILTNYAYRLRLGKGKLSMGLGVGLTMLRSDWTSLAIQQTSDAVFASDSQNALRPNFSAGAFYYTKKWFVGASSPFIMTHKYNAGSEGWNLSENSADIQPMVTGGYVFRINADTKLKPTTLLRYRAAEGLQADLSTNLILKDKVWVGASYRTGDAFIASLEVLPTAQWRLGYAYDLGISSLAAYHAGSHELMVQYEFGYRIRVKDPRYF
jgi:type IX secretion system PorP/SprF family membrane protein